MERYFNDQLTGDILVIEICEKFGWDYYTYMAQPVSFIKMIVEKMKIETKKEKAKASKQEKI